MSDQDKLAADLYALFTSTEDELVEYDIDLIENDDKPFIISERNLLINKKCIKGLYKLVHKRFLSKTHIDMENMYSLLLTIINPNFASAWSRRKVYIVNKIGLNGELSVIRDELRISRLILIKHFKCEHAYMYRRWLFKKLIAFSKTMICFFNSNQISKTFIKNEFSKRNSDKGLFSL
jgi:hypothetical protein